MEIVENISGLRESKHPSDADYQALERWTIVGCPLANNNTLSLSSANCPTKADQRSIDAALFPVRFPFQKQESIRLKVSQPSVQYQPTLIEMDMHHTMSSACLIWSTGQAPG